MSLETALDYAIQIIESYELDIKNSKEIFGIDLAKRGFCQGIVYKVALGIIEKRRKEE